MSKYEVIIYWSELDGAFIAEIPELSGCIAHGDNANDALREVNSLAKEWLKLAKQEGWNIPTPKGKLMYA